MGMNDEELSHEECAEFFDDMMWAEFELDFITLADMLTYNTTYEESRKRALQERKAFYEDTAAL